MSFIAFPNKKLDNSKFENIAFIKTIMMICVVLCHSMAFFSGRWFDVCQPIYRADYLGWISDFTGTFHIQTFAMASGFLFYYLWKKKGRYNEPKKDIKKRAKRLLLPFMFTSVFWAIPIGFYFYHYPLNEIIEKFVLMTGPAQLWFLIMLFIVFVFFELIGKRIKLRFRNLLLIYIATTIVGGLLSIVGFKYFQLAVSAKYILFFYLGEYIYEYQKKISWKQVFVMLAMAAVMYALVVCFGKSENTIIKYGIEFVEPFISVLEVSVIYYLCSKLVQRCKGIVKNKFFRILEENSFGIYLFHQQIIYFTIIWFNGLVHPIVQALLSFVIATAISLLMSMVLKRWKVTRVMFGL